MDLDYIAANEFDDDAFVARVDVIFAGAVGNRVCDEVVVVRVDGFFDRRWFRFAGKVGAAGVHDFGDVVVPPFHPQRIVDERFITGTGPPLHVAQTSEANLRRTLCRRLRRRARH